MIVVSADGVVTVPLVASICLSLPVVGFGSADRGVVADDALADSSPTDEKDVLLSLLYLLVGCVLLLLVLGACCIAVLAVVDTVVVVCRFAVLVIAIAVAAMLLFLAVVVMVVSTELLMSLLISFADIPHQCFRLHNCWILLVMVSL